LEPQFFIIFGLEAPASNTCFTKKQGELRKGGPKGRLLERSGNPCGRGVQLLLYCVVLTTEPHS